MTGRNGGEPRRSARDAWPPAAVHVLSKPTGAICNLGCSYCYFLDKEALYPGDRFLNYLCAGYLRFFRHIDRPMRTIVDLLRSQRQPREIMEIAAREGMTMAGALRRRGRNDPCPCGSGVKAKRCHGAPRVDVAGATKPVPVALGRPRPRVRDEARNRDEPAPPG